MVCAPDGTCLEMGGSAAAIWQALPGPDEPPAAFHALVGELAAAHGVEPEVAARDVDAAIRAWEAVGCVARRA